MNNHGIFQKKILVKKDPREAKGFTGTVNPHKKYRQ